MPNRLATLGIMAVVAFCIPMGFIDYIRSPSRAATVVVETSKYGDIREQELQQMIWRRRQVLRFLQRVEAAVVQAKRQTNLQASDENRVPEHAYQAELIAQMIGGATEEAVVDTWLHARLADYSFALAERAQRTGNPIVHPLVFDWPNDPRVRDIWDQYLYGPALLVAPVWELGRRERDVYLPAGEWIDLWDRSRRYRGPTTLRVHVPLDRIPVYIRAGAEERIPADLVEGL